MKQLADFISEVMSSSLKMPDYQFEQIFGESDVEFSDDTMNRLKKAFNVNPMKLYTYFIDAQDDFQDEDSSVNDFDDFINLIDKSKEIDKWHDDESDADITIYKTPAGQVIGHLTEKHGDFHNILSAQRTVK